MGSSAWTAAAVIAASTAMTASVGAGTASAAPGAEPTPLAFQQTLRRCDFSEFQYAGAGWYGRPTGQLRNEGGTLVADLQFATGVPNARYDVRLVQAPRSSALSCNPGDPGVAGAPLFTNGAGGGAVTVRAPIAPGATGAWLTITRPQPFSQQPVEFYSTNFIVSI